MLLYWSLISAFERVSGRKLKFQIGPRRAGDVVAVYADNQKARKQLGWSPAYGLDKMMETAWKWEQKLQLDEQMHLN
ncbi:MAG: GDP-mannose 4,6-dehydratase [Chitinophagaceae bacterium]